MVDNLTGSASRQRDLLRNGNAARLELLRATLRHAVTNTDYYRRAFDGLNPHLESFEDLRRFPLLNRDTFAKHGTELLIEGAVPEYIGVTSGTSFGDTTREPLLHYQTEIEHRSWISLYASMTEEVEGERPIMLRLTDADRGVEIAGAFPGCFSVPMENLYHFELILSTLKREWSFRGFSKRVVSLSGPLDTLQLLTLLCMEHQIDPSELAIGLVSSSGWQMTSRWRMLLESYWGADIQDVYGISEAPGMFATRCAACSHYHFSPLSVIETLRIDNDDPVTAGIGRVVVTCLLPVAQAQPIIRYDTGDVIDIVGTCGLDTSFEYVGRRSKLIWAEDARGSGPILWPIMVTEILDSIPSVALDENPKARTFGLRTSFGWPRYSIRYRKDETGKGHAELTVELRWPPVQYGSAAHELKDGLLRRIFDASPGLLAAVNRGAVGFDIHLVEPGAIANR